jgi:hypothetical protein
MTVQNIVGCLRAFLLLLFLLLLLLLLLHVVLRIALRALGLLGKYSVTCTMSKYFFF